MNVKTITTLALSAFLLGCGSSDDNDTQTPSQGEDTEVVENNTTAIKNISYVQGIYDISFNNDEVYLSIGSDGVINTYDYQGDSVDNGLNCYAKNLSTGYNQVLNSSVLINDEENKLFTSNNYNWHYNDDQNISNVSISGISAGGILSINNTRIATSKYLTTNITIEEIQQSLCN